MKLRGRLQTRTWEGDGGRKRTTTEIVADSFEVEETPEADYSEDALLGGDDALPF